MVNSRGPTTLLSKRCLVEAFAAKSSGDKICGVVRSSLRRATGRNFIYTYSASFPLNTAFRFTSYLALASRFASPCHRVPLFAALVALPRFVPFRRASSTIFFCSPLHLLDLSRSASSPDAFRSRRFRPLSLRSVPFRTVPTKEESWIHPTRIILILTLYRAKAPPRPKSLLIAAKISIRY